MKKTAAMLKEKKVRGDKITMLTCYDYPTAQWQEEEGIDVIHVGDSVGTNVLGYESEKEVTLDDIRHHLRAVRRGVTTAYLLADLPYGTCEDSLSALQSARALLADGVDGVKLEGYKPEIIAHLVKHGIEVCAHLGLNPQIHVKMTLQARSSETAMELMRQSLELQEAGAFMIVYELVPEEVAAEISTRLDVPTIGIGAGRFTDGQVLVVLDMLGINTFDLRHNRRYEEIRKSGTAAIRAFVKDVSFGKFPGVENVRHLPEKEADEFKKQLKNVNNTR
jgi:3-methyl-2-oxobutanoate hydroxymethyltransferase